MTTPLIDLHSHILPGIDDGAADADESLAMLRMAVEDGIATIAATPHAAQCDPAHVSAAVAALNRSARYLDLPITIVGGSEVLFAADLAARYRDSRLLTLNHTRYILLELPLRTDWPPFLQQGIFDLQVTGALPILTHPERYRAVQRDPLILSDLIAGGLLIQITAGSLLGHLGATVQGATEALVRRRMVHLLASDAHNATGRPPRIRQALDRVADLTDEPYATFLRTTAASVLRGDAFATPEPDLTPRPSWTDRLRHRLRASSR